MNVRLQPVTITAIPNHVAVVPNGNRRGSRISDISLEEAYLLGAARALEVVHSAKDMGVKHVSFFGLSVENLNNRSTEEIDALMEGALNFCDEAMDLGFTLHPFGFIDEFAGVEKYEPLYRRLKRLREDYEPSDQFTIHVAANYSGKAQHELRPLFEALYNEFPVAQRDPMKYILSGGVPDVDLFIRTGGEQRTSGLLPFQSSYAELYFTPTFWPDFTAEKFQEAVKWFGSQPRNFGR